MNEQQPMTEQRLRRMAQARAAFKIHLLVYLGVMATVWAVNVVINYGINVFDSIWLWWAIWPTLGWGVGVLMHGIGTYIGTGIVDREYEKLRRRMGGGPTGG